jgi:hypothetical protein
MESGAVGHIFNFSISRFIPILQIRHILMKDHIQIFFSETAGEKI